MDESTSNRQIKIGAILSYTAIAISILSGLLYTPWMIRSIGQSNYGLYTLVGSFISMFMMDFGIGSAVSRFISKYLACGEHDKVNGLLSIVYKLYIIIDVIIFAVLFVIFFFINTIYVQLTPEEISKFKIIYIIVGAYNLFAFPLMPLNGILTSYEKFYQLKLCDIFNRVSVVLFMVIALLCGLGLYTLVLVNTLCGVVTLVIKLIIVKKDTDVKVDFHYKSKNLVKEILGFSVWVTVVTICQRLIFNIMPSILAAFIGSASVAVFGVASTIEGYVFTFSDAINGLFLPKTSRIEVGEEGHEQLMQLLIKVGRVNFTVVGLIITGFFCAGKEFITLWMGNDYMTAYYCVILMVLPELLSFPQQIAHTDLLVKNMVKYEAYINVIMSAINIAVSCMICRYTGVLGAGISIGVAYFVKFILMNVVYKTKLHLELLRFFKECYLKMCVPIIITAVLGSLLFKYIAVHGWMIFCVKCIIVFIIYLLSMWFFGFNKYEKNMYVGFIKSIKNNIIKKKR